MSPAVASAAHGHLAHAPILRASHESIRALAARRSTSLVHYQNAIEGDPAMALNLFVDVNRALKRAGRTPVSDVQRAILFAGIAQVPDMLTQAAVLEDLTQPPLLEELNQRLSIAHHASRQAKFLSASTPGLNGDEMLAAALTRTSAGYVDLLNEQTDVTFDHRAVKDLMPTPASGPDTQAAGETCLDLATQFAELTQSSWRSNKLASLFAEIAEFTGRDVDDVAKDMRLTTLEAARRSRQFGYYPAALNLMDQGALEVSDSGPDAASEKARISTPRAHKRNSVSDPPPRKVKRKSAAQASPAAGSQSAPAKPVTRVSEARTEKSAKSSQAVPKETSKQAQAPSVKRISPSQVRDAEPLASVLSQLKPAAGDKQAAARMLKLGLAAICVHTPPRLAVMLAPGAGDETLCITAHHGVSLTDAVLSLEIPLSRNPLLSKIIGRAAAFQWLPERHGDKLHGLPLKLMGGKPGFLYSIVANNEPVGVIMACRPKSDVLSATDFETFKRICAAIKAAQ